MQLHRTMDELQRLGLAHARFDDTHNLDLAGVDIVHIFNLTRLHDTYLHARNAWKQGVPYVLTPIWHSFRDLSAFYRSSGGLAGAVVRTRGIAGYLALKEVMYALASGGPPPPRVVLSWMSMARWVARNAAAVLPNSSAEQRAMEQDLSVVTRRTHVVPNAAEIAHVDRQGPRQRMVICAGRIEPLKNQIAILDAFLSAPAMSGHQLVFVGPPNPGHRSYLRRFEGRLDGNRTKWLGAQPREKLLDLFSRADIAVLASFFETTGLAALEALATGASVVVTDRGYTRDYFGGHATYCDPYDIASIRQAMTSASSTRHRPPQEFFRHHSWETAAHQTRAAYDVVLGEAEGQ